MQPMHTCEASTQNLNFQNFAAGNQFAYAVLQTSALLREVYLMMINHR